MASTDQRAAIWARTLADSDVTQHSFCLFDTEANARSAEATFTTLRNLPDAPAVFVRVDACKLVGQG